MEPSSNRALLGAAYNGNVSAIIKALQDGADPNCIDIAQGFHTPLSYAAGSESPEAVSVLLEGGADITESIFAFFVAKNNNEILELLVRANPKFAFKEFDELDMNKGIEYITQKRALEEAGYTDAFLQSDPELRRISGYMRFAEKIKEIARRLRGGRRRSRVAKKRTYRRSTFNR
jgi:hypothetical protein